MYHFEKYDDEKDFSELLLLYKVEPMGLNSYERKMHLKNYEQLKKALEDVGVNFTLNDDWTLLVSLKTDYLEKRRRYAGRHQKTVWSEDGNGLIRYSDVVYMLQHMTNKEVAAKIKMPINTFYRHRDKMLKSEYYKKVDKNKLDNKAYLESLEGNFKF